MSETRKSSKGMWGARLQMAREMFGEPAHARQIPLRTTSNKSSDHKKGVFDLSWEMMDYLAGPEEMGTTYYRKYLESDAPNAKFYLDFLRLIYKYAPEDGISTHRMIEVLSHRWEIKQAQVYRKIKNAENFFMGLMSQDIQAMFDRSLARQQARKERQEKNAVDFKMRQSVAIQKKEENQKMLDDLAQEAAQSVQIGVKNSGDVV